MTRNDTAALVLALTGLAAMAITSQCDPKRAQAAPDFALMRAVSGHGSQLPREGEKGDGHALVELTPDATVPAGGRDETLPPATVPYIVALDRPAVTVPMAWAQDAGTVIQCESHWNAAAVNRTSGATGLLQLMRVHERRAERMGYTWADMLDPVANVTVAIAIWREQSWRPWECAR